MNKPKLAVAIAALLPLAACERASVAAADADRDDAAYRVAMTDYNAGNLDSSIANLEKVLSSNPANASARFQLACLLHEHRHDYLGAIANYRVYLQQCPAGGKAGPAAERAALCEKLLAPVLAKKMNLLDNAAILAENARLKDELVKMTKERDEFSAKLTRSEDRSETLAKENERVRKLVEAAAGGEEPLASPDILPDEKALLDDDADEDDRIKMSEDVKSLVLEEKTEREPLDAPFKPEDLAKAKERKSDKAEPSRTPLVHEPRPEIYTVQEGDTLYQLAIRFYGRRSAWKLIHNANRTSISTDGRIKTGQKLILPDR